MAVVRCKSMDGRRARSSVTLTPTTSSLTRDLAFFCGTGNCTQLALNCWLTDEEEQEYLRWKRFVD
jgi:hypothetical protein